MGILEALMIEAFCSIHMSVFVLYPIAKIKHPEDYKEHFKKFNCVSSLLVFLK